MRLPHMTIRGYALYGYSPVQRLYAGWDKFRCARTFVRSINVDPGRLPTSRKPWKSPTSRELESQFDESSMEAHWKF